MKFILLSEYMFLESLAITRAGMAELKARSIPPGNSSFIVSSLKIDYSHILSLSPPYDYGRIDKVVIIFIFQLSK